MGYSEKQRDELEQTINAVDCDLVLVATPIDLASIVKIRKPSVRVRYELSCPELEKALMARLSPLIGKKGR